MVNLTRLMVEPLAEILQRARPAHPRPPHLRIEPQVPYSLHKYFDIRNYHSNILILELVSDDLTLFCPKTFKLPNLISQLVY